MVNVKPKISIIVPVYNAAGFLSKCIDSIMCQTVQDFELLLINDGSVDKSGDLCEAYAAIHPFKIFVHHQKNAGVSAARNKGLDHARGRYIVFIDSDDYVSDGYLSAFFQSEEEPKNAIVQQGFIREYREGNKRSVDFERSRFTKAQFSDLFLSKQLIRRLPFICSKQFDGTIIREHHIRFNSDVPYGEDLIFLLENFYYLDEFQFSDESLYHYILTNQSSTYRPHSYEAGLLRFDLVSGHLERLNAILGLNQKAQAYNKSYIPIYLTRAIRSLYLAPYKKTWKKRLGILKELRSTGKYALIAHHLKPFTFTDKVLKALFSYNMVFLPDLFLFLYLGFHQIKKRAKR